MTCPTCGGTGFLNLETDEPIPAPRWDVEPTCFVKMCHTCLGVTARAFVMAEPFVAHFRIPARAMMSANTAPHWATKAAQVRVLRIMGQAAVKGRTMDRAHVLVRVGWPDRRRRDVDNIAPTIKALIDGMVTDGGLLPDDDDTHLVGPDKRPYHAGDKGHTLLTFTFRPLTEYEEA